MAMPHDTTVWTPEMALALPGDGNRYEVVDGELIVTPAPRPSHQIVLRELFLRLEPYVREQRVGLLLWSPADISLDPRALVQPDLFVVPLPDERPPREWREVASLVLAVEALSPASARADRGAKRRLYQRWRVPDYWIVDADARLVERWRPEDERPEVADGELLWHPAGVTEPLRLDLAGLFTTALG